MIRQGNDRLDLPEESVYQLLNSRQRSRPLPAEPALDSLLRESTMPYMHNNRLVVWLIDNFNELMVAGNLNRLTAITNHKS